MALKSGRVGVDRSQVDAHGKIIGGSDSYTKQQADNKFATKSSLTANSKQFMFAYDEETQKYGYKAGGADTFHPFSAGGFLVMDGLTINEKAKVNGGYHFENGLLHCYFEIEALSLINANEILISGLPTTTGSTTAFKSASTCRLSDKYFNDVSNFVNYTISNGSITYSDNLSPNYKILVVSLFCKLN